MCELAFSGIIEHLGDNSFLGLVQEFGAGPKSQVNIVHRKLSLLLALTDNFPCFWAGPTKPLTSVLMWKMKGLFFQLIFLG